MNTQTQKILATMLIIAGVFSFSSAFAATEIGQATVTGDTAGTFTGSIQWDDNLPGTATGSVENIVIKAQVLPSLSMEISASEIDLGTLVAGTASTGSLSLEVGTNAVSGITVTARSQTGGLTNQSDTDTQINSLTTDGLAESYTWESAPNATNDSSNSSFAATGLTALEVNDDTTEHTVYSTNKPESITDVNDVVFTVNATAGAETPAGEYRDQITFTITGNF